MPYTALQSMFDDSVPWGRFEVYERSAYLDDFDDRTIATFTEHAGVRTSPSSQIIVYVLGGALADVPDGATAFGGRRDAGYLVFVVGMTEPGQIAAERDWVRRFTDALGEVQDTTAYTNGVTDANAEEVRRIYGAPTYARLAAVKAAHDPSNVLRRNVNIAPS